MAAEKNETKLTTDYETLRRREYQLITDLLAVLPKIDNLEDEHVTQARDDLRAGTDHPRDPDEEQQDGAPGEYWQENQYRVQLVYPPLRSETTSLVVPKEFGVEVVA